MEGKRSGKSLTEGREERHVILRPLILLDKWGQREAIVFWEGGNRGSK